MPSKFVLLTWDDTNESPPMRPVPQPPMYPSQGLPWAPGHPANPIYLPPVDPGYGRPSWGPVDPGYGVGGGLHPAHPIALPPLYPDHTLPTPPAGTKPTPEVIYVMVYVPGAGYRMMAITPPEPGVPIAPPPTKPVDPVEPK